MPSLQKVLRVDIEAGWDLQAGQDRASRSQGLATLGADEELNAREPLQSLERGRSGAQEPGAPRDGRRRDGCASFRRRPERRGGVGVGPKGQQEMGERRVAEGPAEAQLGIREGRRVLPDRRRDGRMVRTRGLDRDETGLLPAPDAPRRLCYELKGPLGRTEVRKGKGCICIQEKSLTRFISRRSTISVPGSSWS